MFEKKPKKEIKTWHLIFIGIMIVTAVGFKIYNGLWPKAIVTIGGEKIKVLVADTYPHQVEGWSNHKTMGNYEGMLFVFSARDQHTMVMRDMEFPLDIVWLDGKTIVDMAPNIPSEKGKSEEALTPYFARLPSTLVLELPAGFIEKNGLKIGDEVEIKK